MRSAPRAGKGAAAATRPAAVEETSRFDLGGYLPYLINRVGSRLAVAFGRAIAPHGIALQEWRVLAALGANGAQRLLDLAALTSIDVSTLSRLVGRMVRRRLVRRDRNGNDRREVSVALTPDGQRIFRMIVPLARRYEQIALRGLKPDEAARLRNMLRRIYANLSELPD